MAKEKIGNVVVDTKTGEIVGPARKRPAWMDRKGSFEIPDQSKPNIPVGFAIPESLEQQIARMVRSQISKQTLHGRAMELDEEFEDLEAEINPLRSPHEVVVDEELGVEVTRWEKEAIDQERKAFDAKAREYAQRAKERAISRKKAAAEVKKKDENKPKSDDEG